MTGSWTEVWSYGRGSARTYCGISRTYDGFAVDVFHGFTCLETTVHETHDAAMAMARACRARYRRAGMAARKARQYSRELVYASWPLVADSGPRPSNRRRLSEVR